MTAFDVQKRTAQYVQLRDKIKEMEAHHDEELRPYKELLKQLNGVLLKHLDSEHVDSMKTECGTVYVFERQSASVVDPDVFFKHVQETGDWDLMERRANVTAVRAYIQERAEANDPAKPPTPPPGVNFSQMRQVGVRRV